MVEGRRADLRRMGSEQNAQYKRILAFVIFLTAALSLITATFFESAFYEGTDSNKLQSSRNRPSSE